MSRATSSRESASSNARDDVGVVPCTTTRAPCAARCRAMTRPIPREEPVTHAIRPRSASLPMSGAYLGVYAAVNRGLMPIGGWALGRLRCEASAVHSVDQVMVPRLVAMDGAAGPCWLDSTTAVTTAPAATTPSALQNHHRA